MFFEPRIQVKTVIDPPATKTDAGHIELRQQRQPDAEVQRGLLLGEAAHRGQWQGYLIHHTPRSGNPCLAR